MASVDSEGAPSSSSVWNSVRSSTGPRLTNPRLIGTLWDRVELLGLTYGLHEVIRNIREASNAVRDLDVERG